MTRQVTDQLYIELDYYNPEEYYTYVAEASVAMSASFSQTAQGYRTQEIALIAFSDAAISTTATVTKGTSANLSLESTVTIAVGGVQEFDAALSSEFNKSATASKIVETVVSLSSEFTQSVIIDRIVTADTALVSSVSMSTQADRFVGFGVGLSSDAAAACVNYRVRDFDIAESALFNVAMTIEVTRNSFAILESAASVAASVDRLQGAVTANLNAEFTQSVQADKLKSIEATLSADVNISLLADRIRSTTITTSATATQSVDPNYILLYRDQTRIQYSGTYARISTTQKKFGTYSLKSDDVGATDFPVSKITGGSLDIYDFDANDWTIEFFYYDNEDTSSGEVFERIFALKNSSGTSRLDFYRRNNATANNNTYHLESNDWSTTSPITSSQSIGTWRHFAFTYVASTKVISFYLDGSRIGTRTFTGASWANMSRFSLAGPTYAVGNAYTDELRISDQVRYTGTSYTVPSSTFSKNRKDVALFKFEQEYFENSYYYSDSEILLILGSAALSSEFSQSAAAITVKLGSADLSSQGFVLAAVGRIATEVANLSSSTALQAQVGRLQLAESSLNSSATVAANVFRLIEFSSTISGAFTATVTAQANEGFANLTLTAPATLTANANVNIRISAALTSAATVSATGLGFARYWLTVSETASANNSKGWAVDSDSQRNVYASGYYYPVDASESWNLYVNKYSKLGDVVWSKQIKTTTGFNLIENELVTDSSGNTYITGSINETWPTVTYTDFYLLKLNSSGVIQWSRFLRAGNGTNQSGYKVDLDSSGNVYTAGLGRVYTGPSTPDEQVGLIAKYTSSGTLTWQKKISGIYSIYGIVVRGSNFYVTGETSGASARRAFIAKLDLDGNIIWQRSLGDVALISEQGLDIALDSLNNVYVAGQDFDVKKVILAKFDNNGNLVYQKFISKSGIELSSASMTVNNSDELLLSMVNDTDITTVATIDLNGNLVRARSIDANFYDIDYDVNLDILLTGIKSNEFITAKIPFDGSRVEMAQVFNYQVDNGLIFETADLTVSTTTSTVSASSFSTSAYSITQADNGDAYTIYLINSLVTGTGSFTATATSVANIGRIRRVSSSTSSTASQVTVGRRIAGGSSTQSVTATMSVTAQRFRTTDSTQSATFTQSTSGQRVRFADFIITANASLAASAARTRNLDSAVSAAASVITDNQRVRFADIQTDSIATQLTAVGKNATGTILMESQTAQSTLAVKTVDITSSQIANTEQSTTADRIRDIESDLSAQADLTIDYEKIRPAGGDLTAEFGISINSENSRIVGINSTQASVFTAVTDNLILRQTGSAMLAEATVTALGFRVKQVAATINSQATIVTLTGIRADAQATLPVVASQLTVGEVIQIDPFYQYQVQPETRRGTVLPENRVFLVESETRVNIII